MAFQTRKKSITTSSWSITLHARGKDLQLDEEIKKPVFKDLQSVVRSDCPNMSDDMFLQLISLPQGQQVLITIMQANLRQTTTHSLNCSEMYPKYALLYFTIIQTMN